MSEPAPQPSDHAKQGRERKDSVLGIGCLVLVVLLLALLCLGGGALLFAGA